jgi:ubiquinone/menaquinone biosynthesis C-methylase UbiE
MQIKADGRCLGCPEHDLGTKGNLDALMAILGDVRGLDMVDIGCGNGALARSLHERGANSTGVDPLVEPWESPRTDVASCRIIKGFAENLPIGNQCADVVTFIFSLHHVPKPSLHSALFEACRLLRDDGCLYVAEPMVDGSFQQLIELFHDETEVRASAMQVLTEEIVPLFELSETYRYVEPRRFPNFEAFAARMENSSRFNQYDLVEIRKPEVVRRFDRLSAANGGTFDQPVTVRVLSGPKGRAAARMQPKRASRA